MKKKDMFRMLGEIEPVASRAERQLCGIVRALVSRLPDDETSPEAGSDGQRSRPSQSCGDVLRALTTFRAWLMGEVTVEGGAFRSRRDGEGPYYWRTEARDRLAAIEAMLVAPHKPRISREVFNKCVLAAAHASIPDGLDIETQTRAVLEAAGMEVER